MARRPNSTPPIRNIILFILLAIVLYLYREGFFGPSQTVPTPGQPTEVTVTPAVSGIITATAEVTVTPGAAVTVTSTAEVTATPITVVTVTPVVEVTATPVAAVTVAPSETTAPWYEVYFTTPRYPDKPEYHHGSLDEHLVEFINTATQTIDLADYDFDLENVATALAQATQRGVRVRMVTDTDTLTNKNAAIQKAFGILKQANIPILDDKRGPIMHNKFLVVDNLAVWTGSWNFTDGDTYRLNNNAIKIMSPELAQNYTVEFEKMFVQHKFGPNKPAGVPHPVLTIGGIHVENYFAAEDKVASHIIAQLKQAKQSIHFLAFSFTDDAIGDVVIERAKAGVQVAGVFENTGSSTKFSEFGRMKAEDLDVLQDGNPYLMHHKVFIIDNRQVIFGSFNFSNNADRDNDENLLIVNDPQLAAAFEAEFQQVRQVALNPSKK
ncbi:MAG: phospholipase D-like domain-containing protein [Chloroflexi bacterium]|nr:phospholipase D-like domain-containing protein [Chloroflexota bacterium]